MKKPTQKILAAMFVTLGLSACSPDTSSTTTAQNDEAQKADLANRYLLAQLNSDKEVIARVLTELKKIDPTVSDAYFKLDAEGKRTLLVSRQKEDGSVETWEAPAAMVEQVYKSAEASAKEDESVQGHSASSGSSVMPLLGGMLAGYMMANAFNSNNGRMMAMSQEAHKRERERSGGAYAGAVGSSARAMANSGARPPAHIGSKVAEANRASAARAPVGQSARGSFSSSGARAGGYSSGG